MIGDSRAAAPAQWAPLSICLALAEHLPSSLCTMDQGRQLVSTHTSHLSGALMQAQVDFQTTKGCR